MGRKTFTKDTRKEFSKIAKVNHYPIMKVSGAGSCRGSKLIWEIPVSISPPTYSIAGKSRD
jgi:hypothetical protein